MTKSELKEIKKLLIGLAEYLQAQITVDQLVLYSKEFESIGSEGLGRAIVLLKNDPDIYPGKLPLPAKIKSYLVASISSDAKEIVSVIFKTMDLYSNTQQLKAREAMGETAWEVCKSYGGYSSLYRMETSNKHIIYAQLRDLAENILTRRSMGIGTEKLIPIKANRKQIDNSEKEPSKIGSLLPSLFQKDTKSTT